MTPSWWRDRRLN